MNKNKNKWSYRYVAEFIGGGYLDHLVIVTDLGKDYADQQAKNYIENYEYPGRVIDIYYSLTSNRYIPGINYVGKTKESVGKI